MLFVDKTILETNKGEKRERHQQASAFFMQGSHYNRFYHVLIVIGFDVVALNLVQFQYLSSRCQER
ncbi:hypothetical protein CGT95_00940 [Vibrio metoecus]|uniref:Uncharacterized protein n=1 Tax=Vibrio metoecus TaxID=1481663 RepID=A0A0Q0NB45_VIBMT|nr:hypothetical protein AAY55_10555 [Vibrio metoecus]PAR48476.1 hypothetical protein CGT95_00940 [Vibrio metoecus]